jgi:hypothetical protein
MFMIHTPQTVTLAVPGEDGPFTTLNFRTDGADTSRCVLELVSPDGDIHRVTFATRGHLAGTQYIDHEHPEPAPHEVPTDFIVDGRDTRADNPYTHVAPIDANTAYLPPGGVIAPVPLDGEGKPVVDDAEERPKALKAAEEAAGNAREERAKQARETPDERRERLAAERKPDGDLRTMDDTTANDLAWDAPHENSQNNPNPFAPEHGRVNTTQSMQNRIV